MVGRLAVVLLVLGLSDANIVFRRDSTSSRTSSRSGRSTPTFTDAELECFIQQKVLHSDGKCYAIRHQGPCTEDQWLVLDKDEEFEPNGVNRRRLVCKAKPCEQPTRVFWPEDGQCHKLSDKATLCPFQGNELRRDSYGDGECACVKAHIRFKPEVLRGANGTIEWQGACYPLYQRGPCPARKVLIAAYLPDFGPVGECMNDPCRAENSRESGTWYAKRAADGRCYKLGERGPCADKEKFIVGPLTNRPQCQGSSFTTNSLLGDSPMRCDGNINKKTQECRDEVINVVRSTPFVTAMTSRGQPRRVARST